ncbi:MAG: hypothetical protein AB1607_08800 [Chloroflexota bacterium]
MDGLTPIFLFACCFLSVMVIAVIAAVSISRRKEGPKAEAIIPHLAEQMRLTRLDPKRPLRFGGTHQDHEFYIDLGVTGSVSSKSVSLGKAVAVSVEVQMKEPRQGYARCNRGRVSSTTSFDSAFSAKLKYEWLSIPAREAMLAFVRKREDLFLEGLPIHPKADAEDKVRLQHNIPNTAQVTPDQIHMILDELIEVARVIETTC